MLAKVRFDDYTVVLKVTKPNTIDTMTLYEKGKKREVSSPKELHKIKKSLFSKLEYTLDGRSFNKDSWNELTFFHALVMSPEVRLLQFSGEPKTPKLPKGAIA